VETAAETSAALRAVATREFDVVLSGIDIAGSGGFALLREIRDRQPHAVVVLSSERGTVAEALEAMQAGAYDYLPKPISLQHLELLLRCALDARQLGSGGPSAAGEPDLSFILESSSPAMVRAVATARHVAPLEMTILLEGESGTGKSVLATAIHRWSGRRGGPFVTVSCSADERSRREGERSGSVHNPLTGASDDDREWIEAAARGTLFFDEVGTLPQAVQAKLIRFLDEERVGDAEVDQTTNVRARVIAATNRDLEADVRAERFRHDLFFRLNVISIHLPPLRERQRDLPTLSDRILASLCARHHRALTRLTPEVRRAFAAYIWPGNLRELVTVLERATALSREGVIRVEDLPERVTSARR
jgi:DNA-binding NtrC family response regulator